jgi:hypothetical protein
MACRKGKDFGVKQYVSGETWHNHKNVKSGKTIAREEIQTRSLAINTYSAGSDKQKY